ncbi:hypothetical protein EBB59_00825 [Lysobacter pythonis]|uniref:Cytochrome c n=1 Tax=Solilutibacter pythonis TaxID=2483112 RepID=A0A3M2I4C7_9GAMM|nr:cytochrome c [Lysobacter pythonis]RMH94870.1 hypothetical protein EBB59_00825 [Lysobacter pythonis]
MSTPANETPRKKSSAASRYFFMLLLGLVLGAIAAVMAMRALDARKDRFPDSVMTVQAWHMGRLKKNIEINRCNATDSLPHLQTLRRMGDDVDFAYPDLASDERFAKHSANFRAVLDAAQANPPLSCESLKKTVGDIGGQCKACHDDFKKG